MAKDSGLFGSALLATALAGVGVVFLYLSTKGGKINWDDIFGWIKLPEIPKPGGNGNGNGNGNGEPEPTPTPTPTGSTILGAAGDWGSGRNSNYQKTIKVMTDNNVKMVLGLGDYSYTNASDAKKIVDAAKVTCKFSLGNHDSSSYPAVSTQAGFDSGPARIIILNTESGASGNAAFAEKELKATKQPWKILIMHKPLYTNDSDHGAESSLANALKPIINKYGVQLVMYGHNHNYQRIVKTDQPKCVFICSGTGGESHYTLKGNLSGTKYMNDKDFGATIITISGNTLTGKFIAHGGSVKDSWTQSLATSSANLAYAYEAMIPRISI